MKGVCRQCGSQHIAPSKMRRLHPLCVRCENAAPRSLAARRKYAQKANPRRIYAGRRHFGYAATAADAAQINAHLHRRLNAFKQGQSRRTQAEIGQTNRVPTKTGPRTDRLRGGRVGAGSGADVGGQIGPRPSCRVRVRYRGRRSPE